MYKNLQFFNWFPTNGILPVRISDVNCSFKKEKKLSKPVFSGL
jgi:hypothetical protein